jgi:bacillithiol system protein YtxJ
MLNWLNLTDINQLNDLVESSVNQKVIIFKHSTRCSISIMVKDRFERNWPIELADQNVYYLDLLKFRDVSNAIANDLDVAHQSPQLLVIENKICTYFANHNEISSKEL